MCKPRPLGRVSRASARFLPSAMAVPPLGHCSGRCSLLSLSLAYLSPPSFDQRLTEADTPSRVDLLKSPPGFTYLNPQSIAFFPSTLSRFENVKYIVLVQNTFSVFTEMPLDLFCS